MAKNIPITARVSKGLFGQKVSEPVLNVGQAGVSANNATKNTPSPAKQMNNPASKKQESTSSYERGGNMFGVYKSLGASTFRKGKEITKSVFSDDYDGSRGYMSPENWTKFLSSTAGAAYKAKHTKEVGTGEFEPDEKSKGQDVVGTAKGELLDFEKEDRNLQGPFRIINEEEE